MKFVFFNVLILFFFSFKSGQLNTTPEVWSQQQLQQQIQQQQQQIQAQQQQIQQQQQQIQQHKIQQQQQQHQTPQQPPPPHQMHPQLNELHDSNVLTYQTPSDHAAMPTEHVQPTSVPPVMYDMNGSVMPASNVNVVNQTVHDPNAIDIETQAINNIIPDTLSSAANAQELAQALHTISQSTTSNEQNILQSHTPVSNVVPTPVPVAVPIPAVVSYPAAVQPQTQSQPQVVSQAAATTAGLVPQKMQPNQPTSQQTIQPQPSQIVSTSVPQPIQNAHQILQSVQSQQIPQPQPQMSVLPQQQQPAEQDQSQQQQQPPSSQMPTVNSGSNTNVAPSTKSAQSGESKTRRSNKSSERIPKLVILSVQNGTLVDCSMESKLKTIKFKFDISDVNPIDVANDLVSNSRWLNRFL